MKKVLNYCVILILASSCAPFKHGNFNKQKFTHLKTKTFQNTANTSLDLINQSPVAVFNPDSLNFASCDTLYNLKGDTLYCTILTQTNDYIKYTDCPPTESHYRIYKDQLLDKEGVTNLAKKKEEENLAQKKEETTNKTNPKSASSTQSTFYATAWDKSFKKGLVIFILTTLCYIFAIFTTFFFLFPASIGILISWIISLKLMAKGSPNKRKFDSSEVAYFKIKYVLATLVASIGIILVSTLLISLLLIFLL